MPPATRQAKSFDDVAREEARRAVRHQVVAVVALVVSAGAAGWFVARIPPEDVAFSNLLPRLSVAVPGLVLFAYFVSEATAHRRQAAWARQITVQLDTIDAYTRILDEVCRKQLLLSFGQAVYLGASLALVVSGRRKDGATELADVHALLRELKELVSTATK